MSKHVPRTTLPICAAIIVAGGWLAMGGNLNPPAGPVAPTMKPLDEVEPRIAVNATNTPGDADSLYKITQAGSYYLTGNITGEAGKHGIEIVASGVTLDLMGFELLGVPGSLDGVSATVGVTHGEIRDGSVRSWGDEGIDFTNGGSIGVTGVTVSSCAGSGISVNTGSTVTGCKMLLNGAAGIATGGGCVVTDCTARSNTGGGILAWDACSVTNCSAYTNNGNGISARTGTTISGCASFDNASHGVQVLRGCTIIGCTMYANTGAGLFAGDGCIVTNTTAYDNDASGLIVGGGCAVTACTARENVGNGITATDGNTVTDCTAFLNSGNGISALSGNTISACTCYDNTNHGIVVTSISTITGCTVRSNALDGIEVASRCTVRNNLCDGNGDPSGAGILAVIQLNHIEGNRCYHNARGIETNGNTNVIVGNTCGGNNPNYAITANNWVGVIVRPPDSPTISGSSGGAGLGTTDPWANFTY